MMCFLKVVDGQIYAKGTDERDPGREHWCRLKELGLSQKALIIFDRGYYSKELYEDLASDGCHVLMRLNKSSNLSKLDSDDISWVATSKDGKPVYYRVVKVPLPESSDEGTEYLITNIEDSSITPCEIYNLYFERWNIETKYRELKEWWELEEFTGTTCNSVEQELYINLLLSNIAALVKTEADTMIQNDTVVKKAWTYQAKRTFIVGEIKDLVPGFLFQSKEILRY